MTPAAEGFTVTLSSTKPCKLVALNMGSEKQSCGYGLPCPGILIVSL